MTTRTQKYIIALEEVQNAVDNGDLGVAKLYGRVATCNALILELAAIEYV